MRCHAILIVEDELDIRENLRLLLEMEGYEVFTASNGKEALEVLKTVPRPCLILLDMLMPVMNGEEFLQAKDHDAMIATIPVRIVSGISDRPRMTGGAVAFIKKPVEFDGLLRFIDNYCHLSSSGATA